MKIITDKKEHGNIESSLEYFTKFNISKNAKILDIGCSYGSLIYRLYKLGYYNVYGIDTNKDFIKIGKDVYCEIKQNLSIYGGKKIPFDNGTFDIIFMFDVIEHIPNVKEFLSEEVSRVLKKDGMFIFQTPNKPMNILWVYIDNHSFNVEWWKEHCSLQTFGSLKKLLINSGFNYFIIEKFNIWTEHNKNKVKLKLGFFGLILLKLVSFFPIYIFTNFWGYAKKNDK